MGSVSIVNTMSNNSTQLPVIDFTTLPIEEAVVVLRNMGRHLLTSILDGTEPQLLDALTPENAALFVSSLGFTRRHGAQLYAGQSRLRRLSAMAWSQLRRLLQQERRYPYADTVKQAVASKLSRRAWQARVQDELEHQLELHRGYRLPPDFWALIGERAWHDTAFRRDSAELLERTLRQRVLFSAEIDDSAENALHFPTMLLSPQLFWLLFALAVAATRLNWTYRVFPGRRRVRRMFKLLQTEGMRHGLQSGWATVWDQWVILEAAAFWPNMQRPQSLTNLLRQLPLAQYRAGAMTTLNQVTEPELITRVNWHDTVPRWFVEWNQHDTN